MMNASNWRADLIQTVCVDASKKVRATKNIADALTAQHFASGRRACWAPHLRAEFNRPYMHRLRQYLVGEELRHQIFPQPERIFEALDETRLDEVKVVVIGQDPYPGAGEAHGLAFSVECGKRPQSLCKIFAEVERNMNQCPPPGSSQRTVAKGCNCLTPWARQGVLLLNRVLTVREGCAGAHQSKGWECFTDRIIETISKHRKHVVFMLWGEEAKHVRRSIDGGRHKVLCARHPRVGLKGSKHFSEANRYLKRHKIDPIDWLDVCDRPPPEEQEAVPPLTSADAADEARWDRTFAASLPRLEELAAAALQERRLGLTEELDPSRL